MKIAINLWILRNKDYDGLGIVAIHTISEMIRNNPLVEFFLLVDKQFKEKFFEYPNATKHYIFPALRHPILYVIYLETVLPSFLKNNNIDVHLSMDSFLSLRSKHIQVSMLADINSHHFPKDIPFRNRIYYNTFLPLFAKKATRIATLSNFSKEDIASAYNIDKNKIDIIYCGIRNSFSPIPNEIKTKIRLEVTGGSNYFFFVGSMNPRKNIPRLLMAFNEFKKNTNNDLKLVIAGKIVWQEDKVKNDFDNLEHKEDIIFLGRVSDEDLNNYLGSAYALCFVPLFEGFGLPIVEAWACDVPVIASTVTSVPEVGGDAVLLANPYDQQDIAYKMQLLFENKNNIVEDLIHKGRNRRTIFTWENTAKLLWHSVEQASIMGNQ